MKIYINTDNTPATIASTYKISEGTGPIKPYTFGATATSFEFKRGNDVEIEVAFAGTQAPSVAELAKLTMGLKVSGQYDTALALKAETQTFVADDDGLAVGTLKFNISGSIIDEALKVNTGAEDDVASAAFSLEFQWTGTDGNVHATKTLSATITNNVIRDGDAPAGPGYNVGVVMLVECTQAEYDAIEDKPEHVYYLITDAENAGLTGTIDAATTKKLGTVKLSTGNSVQNGSLVGFNANGQLSVPVAGVYVAGTVRLCTSHAQEVNQCGWTGVSSKGELLVMKPALTGTARRFGAVRIADSLNDTDAYACPTAAQVRAGLQGVTPIDTTGFVDLTSDQQIAGAKTIFGSWLRFAADETDIETGAVKILGTRGGIYFQVEGKPNFAMINLDNLTKIEEIAFKSEVNLKADVSALTALEARVTALENGTGGSTGGGTGGSTITYQEFVDNYVPSWTEDLKYKPAAKTVPAGESLSIENDTFTTTDTNKFIPTTNNEIIVIIRRANAIPEEILLSANYGIQFQNMHDHLETPRKLDGNEPVKLGRVASTPETGNNAKFLFVRWGYTNLLQLGIGNTPETADWENSLRDYTLNDFVWEKQPVAHYWYGLHRDIPNGEFNRTPAYVFTL